MDGEWEFSQYGGRYVVERTDGRRKWGEFCLSTVSVDRERAGECRHDQAEFLDMAEGLELEMEETRCSRYCLKRPISWALPPKAVIATVMHAVLAL